MRPLTAEHEVQRGSRLPAGVTKGSRVPAPVARAGGKRDAWRGSGGGARPAPARRGHRPLDALVSPLVYLIDAFASRRVRAKSGGCGSVSAVRVSSRRAARAIGRFVYVNGPVYRTVRIAPPRVTK